MEVLELTTKTKTAIVSALLSDNTVKLTLTEAIVILGSFSFLAMDDILELERQLQ